jgi:zinc resistance-associated protein
MKRILIISAILLLVGAVATPLMAHGLYDGRGGHMMGRWGGPENGPYYGRGYDTLTTEQREQLDALHKKFYDETDQLRKDLWDKRAELDTVLNATNPDIEKAKTIQGEISTLQAKLAQKQVEFEVEARKINPDVRYGQGYGRGMMNYGPRGGTRGGAFGPGACWR